MLQELCDELKVDALNVYVLDSVKPPGLRLVATVGLDAGVIGYKIPLDTGLVSVVARTRRPLSLSNPHEHPEFHYVKGSGEEKYATFIGIPVIEHGELIGVLVAQTYKIKLFKIREIDALYEAAQDIMHTYLRASA